MTLNREHIELAVKNIAAYGDTDVFPYPFETHIFHDKPQDVVSLIENMDKNYSDWIVRYPPNYVKSLSTSGYVGFRSPSQIDPFWNAYFLALTISIADEIEASRIPTASKSVFSYRISMDRTSGALFDSKIGWHEFHEESLIRAKDAGFVLTCDISDFYSRVYHHRLENSLSDASEALPTIQRIIGLLAKFSAGKSYGIPIGGPASRILAESLLNRVDKLLRLERISFCRFVDDYHLFAASKEQAYSYLVTLSKLLVNNEGLSLQKTKTRILSKDEFVAISPVGDGNEVESVAEKEVADFQRLRIRYDPYAPTADEDYLALCEEINKFDIVAMLGRQLLKPRVDEALTRQLIKAIKFLSPSSREGAILSLIKNISTLYPIFPTIAMLFIQVLNDLSLPTRAIVFDTLRGLIRSQSYIVSVSANLAYAIRVLGYDSSLETEMLLAEIYRGRHDDMIKRDTICAMMRPANRGWISDLKINYNSSTPWEKRALVVASYLLGDEGRHWRQAISNQLSPMDKLVQSWAAERKQAHKLEGPL